MPIPTRLSDLVTQIDFAVRAETLQSNEITRLLGVIPTRAFEKGDPYVGREKSAEGAFREVERVRPWGVWHFSTAGLVKDNSVESHGIFLLDKLEPAKERIRRLTNDGEYRVVLNIWYVGPSGFTVSGSVMARLAELCEEITITCWEVDEVEKQDRQGDIKGRNRGHP